MPAPPYHVVQPDLVLPPEPDAPEAVPFRRRQLLPAGKRSVMGMAVTFLAGHSCRFSELKTLITCSCYLGFKISLPTDVSVNFPGKYASRLGFLVARETIRWKVENNRNKNRKYIVIIVQILV